MNSYNDKVEDDTGQTSCAYFGEGVIFKGSIIAPEKVVVHGTVEGELIARDLVVGPSGEIKGKVTVDQADIQGKIFDQIEAKVCLTLRKTGRIVGSASYGDIEIEKGGIMSGNVSNINLNDRNEKVAAPKIQTHASPSQAVLNSTSLNGTDLNGTNNRPGLEQNKTSNIAAIQKNPAFEKSVGQK